MPLTFTSWTACDDPANPTLDWSSPAALDGRLAWRYAEALRQALHERFEFVHDYQIPVISKLYAPLTDGRRITDAWIAEFDAYMTALFDEWFVNHTAGGGAWHGVADPALFAPPWTKADLLALCTEATRISTRRLSSAWAFQQYELLQLLRWTRADGYWNSGGTGYFPGFGGLMYDWGPIMSDAVNDEERHSSTQVLWAAAVAEFNAYAWNPSAFPKRGPNHLAVLKSAPPAYSITRERWTWTTDGYQPTHAANVDFYAWFTAATDTEAARDYTGALANKWSRLVTDAVHPAGGGEYSLVLGDFGDNNCTQPPPANGWAIDFVSAILKGDVAGGFIFQ